MDTDLKGTLYQDGKHFQNTLRCQRGEKKAKRGGDTTISATFSNIIALLIYSFNPVSASSCLQCQESIQNYIAKDTTITAILHVIAPLRNVISFIFSIIIVDARELSGKVTINSIRVDVMRLDDWQIAKKRVSCNRT